MHAYQCNIIITWPDFKQAYDLILSKHIDLMHWRHVSITTTPCWGSRLVALRARVVLEERVGALSLSVSARPRASPAVWHAGVGPLAACLAMAHVTVPRLTPNTRGAPFCEVICIRSIDGLIQVSKHIAWEISVWQLMKVPWFGERLLTLCLPSTNSPCATLFWGTLELGRHLEVLWSTRCIFLPINRMENSKKPD